MPIKIHDQAQKTTVHLDHKESYIISIGRLCDNGCKYVLLEKNWSSVIQKGTTSIIENIGLCTGFCTMNMHPGYLISPP